MWTLAIVMPSALMPVLYGPIMDGTGWGRAEVVGFSSFRLGAAAAVGFFLGALIERAGLQLVMLLSILLAATSLAALAFVHSLAAYYSCAALLGAAMMGCITATKTLIARWFASRLGLAVGVALTGAGLAGLIVPSTATGLESLVGWRNTVLCMSALMVLVLVPLYLWKARASPASGAAEQTVDRSMDQPASAQILRSRTFWVVLAAQLVAGGADHAMNEHLPMFLDRDLGLGPTVAAWGFSLTIVAGAAGKLAFGMLFDRYSLRAVALCWLLMAVSIALALPAAGLIGLLAFTLMRGVTHGGTMVDIPICARHVFGTRALGMVIGALGAANALGGALATAALGYGRELTGSYTMSFLALVVLCIAAAVAIASVTPRYR